MARWDAVRRWPERPDVWATVVVVNLLVAVVGAFVVEPDVGDDVPSEPAAAVSTAEEQTAPKGPEAAAAPTVPRRAGSTPATSRRDRERPQSSSVPMPSVAKTAADGTYRYRLDFAMEAPFRKKWGGERATRVTTQSRTPTEVRQLHETTHVASDDDTDGRYSAGLGTKALRWAVDGVYRAVHRSDGSDSTSCTPEETLDLELPLVMDAEWTAATTCTYETSKGTRTSRSDVVAKVTGSQQVAFAGQPTAVWEIVVEETSSMEEASSGDAITTTTTRLFSPDLGVDVRVDVGVAHSFVRYTSTSVLVSFEPA